MGRATEAQELLLSCLRFKSLDPARSGPLVSYDPKIDDRNPVGFEFPPSKLYSSGPNQVWNTIATLPLCDSDLDDMTRQRDDALDMVHRLIDGWGDPRMLVMIVRELAEIEREDEDE